jgi:hypothetical protein
MKPTILFAALILAATAVHAQNGKPLAALAQDPACSTTHVAAAQCPSRPHSNHRKPDFCVYSRARLLVCVALQSRNVLGLSTRRGDLAGGEHS